MDLVSGDTREVRTLFGATQAIEVTEETGNCFFFNVYFWDRERQSMSVGGAETEGDTEFEAGSRLRAVSTEPDAGLEPTKREIMTWAEVGSLTDWATQAPQVIVLMHI